MFKFENYYPRDDKAVTPQTMRPSVSKQTMKLAPVRKLQELGPVSLGRL